MSDSQALLVRDDARLAIALSPTGLLMRTAALEMAALIGRVSTAEEQQLAVNALKSLVEYRQAVEKSRQAVKKPVLDYGRLIDDTAKKASDDTSTEEMRINKLIADFQALEMAKVRAAQQAENEGLTALERERQAELAKAQSHDQLDQINADFHQKAQAAQAAAKPVAPPPRVEGQTVREVWNYEVTNEHLLYAQHPHLVRLEPRRAEILAALNAGQTVQGIRAWKETKVGVR